VTDSGYQAIGKLMQSDGKLYLAFKATQKLRLNSKGYVFNNAGQKIGYITNRSAKLL
jgi:hypothetical protein